MKKILLSSAAAFVVAAGSSAFAADLPTYEAAPMVEAPVVVSPIWTGAYIGAQLGYAWNGGSDNDSCFDGVAGADFADEGEGLPIDGILIGDTFDCEGVDGTDIEFDFDDDGDDFDTDNIFAGLHIGYDHQIGNFVIGAVADVNFLFSSDDDDDDSDGVDLDDVDFDGGEIEDPEFATVNVRNGVEGLDWFGTARLRAGFAAGNFLIYGTGGLAFGDGGGVSTGVTLTGTADEIDNVDTVNGVDVLLEDCDEGAGGVFTCEFGSDDDDDDLNIGWALGAGVDFLATSNFKIGVEYLYVNLGGDDDGDDTTVVFDDIALEAAPGTTLNFDGSESDNDFHTISVRGAFKFGG